MHAYAFPPFSLIPAIINKIRQHHCNIVLIAPLWAEMSWFPDILRLVVAPVIRIPSHKNLLTQLGQKFVRENVGSLKLHAWSLSADRSEIESFRRTLPDTQLKQDDRLPDEFMMPDGKFFSDWCLQREVHPFSATPLEVADFLLHLFQEEKCQVSTIKGYRSTISNTLKFKSHNNIGSDRVISELIKSFELQRPVERSLAPKWDLSCVLSSLCSEPYEPLHMASRFHLTLKTVFLLALATARRVSEIHAFSMDSGHLRFNQSDGSVSLRTQTGFF